MPVCQSADAAWCSAAFLRHVRDKEKESGIQPDPALDAFIKGQLVHGRKETLSAEFILRVLGLDVSTT